MSQVNIFTNTILYVHTSKIKTSHTPSTYNGRIDPQTPEKLLPTPLLRPNYACMFQLNWHYVLAVLLSTEIKLYKRIMVYEGLTPIRKYSPSPSYAASSQALDRNRACVPVS